MKWGPAEDTWLPAQGLHLPSGKTPWTSSAQLYLPCWPLHGASTHTGQEEKEIARNSAKNCEVAKPRAVLSMKKIQCFSLRSKLQPCSVCTGNSERCEGQQTSRGIRSIWTSFRCQSESGFNYRLRVLAAISLFQRGWQCFDTHSSMSLLRHLCDTPRRDQRSEIWGLSAPCWGSWPAPPSPHLCSGGLPFPLVALPYLSLDRVPSWKPLLAYSRICVCVPQHSDLPTHLLISQPSSVLTVPAFPLQKSLSLSWKEKSVHKKASISAQLPSLLESKGNLPMTWTTPGNNAIPLSAH